jgi:diadenylate cyclase
MFDRLYQLVDRLHTYPVWQVVIELAVIWMLVFAVVRFMQGTRAAGALKGLLLILVLATLLVRIIGQREAFQRLTFLYQNFITLAAFTLIVIFQPELRRGLIRLGERPFFRRPGAGTASVIDAVAEASAYLSKAKFGAIIVIVRDTPLRGLVEGGTELGARVSARLLQTIFFPGSALHDLAVVIAGGEIKAAGVQLPLADPEDMGDPTLGSRHRAAVGLTQESDALVVVVSEETGAISIAERGRLERDIPPVRLRETLGLRMNRETGDFSAETHAGAEGAARERIPEEAADARDF